MIGYINVRQAAVYLGVSEVTIRRRIKHGHLPSFQPGGQKSSVRIPIHALFPEAAIRPELHLNPDAQEYPVTIRQSGIEAYLQHQNASGSSQTTTTFQSQQLSGKAPKWLRSLK